MQEILRNSKLFKFYENFQIFLNSVPRTVQRNKKFDKIWKFKPGKTKTEQGRAGKFDKFWEKKWNRRGQGLLYVFCRVAREYRKRQGRNFGQTKVSDRKFWRKFEGRKVQSGDRIDGEFAGIPGTARKQSSKKL